MLKNRILYLLFLSVMVAFLSEYNGWVSMYAFIVTLCLPVVSLICSLPSVFRLKISVASENVCSRNDECGINFSVKTANRFAIPLCSITVVANDLMSGTKRRIKLFPNRNFGNALRVETGHCGIQSFKVVRGYAYDYLGLFKFKVGLPDEYTVTVNPVASPPSPCPNFNLFRSVAYRPKPGGGFSETHEMRGYRPGDPLNAVHWKLSIKTEDLIIREAQEPEYRLIVLTFDLTGDRAKMDATLDELKWVSEKLLSYEVGYSICYIAPNTPELQSVRVDSKDDLKRLFRLIMSMLIKTDPPSVCERDFPQADWRYHIAPDTEKKAG